MAAPSKAWEFQVDDRIGEIAKGLGEDPNFSKEDAPGLKSLLDDYLDPNVEVDDVAFTRRLLNVFKDSTTDNTFSELLHKHSHDEQRRIEKFLDGDSPESLSKDFDLGPSLGFREEIQKLQEASSIVQVGVAGIEAIKQSVDAAVQEQHDWFHSKVEKLSACVGIHKDAIDEAGILVYHNAEFQNWGLNIKNTPSFTCVPKTVKAIQVIVKFAKQQGMSVRCSGYRHSWSPIFARNGNILISMVGLSEVTKLPNFVALPFPESKPTELETIEIVPSTSNDSSGKTLVRIGTATLNERLRRWCIANGKVTIPWNIIMVEVTVGGGNGPICHGAGRKTQTLSDLVRKVEYIDANGELRVVEKPRQLRAASGCFGILGIITHLTLEFIPMMYAMLNPVKMPVIQAVPPPPDFDKKLIPPALLKYWTKLSPQEKEAAQRDFERRANSDYYAEWFWFPYSDYSWVNTWDTTTDRSGVVGFPDDFHIFLSFIQTFAINVLQNAPLMDKLVSCANISEAAVTILSRFAMLALPSKKVTTYLTDALHFQRCIQNVRVRDLEVNMPLVSRADDKIVVDYSPYQRAWWDAILLTYDNSKHCPLRMPLEMRIMGDSNVILAPQQYNKLGTCAIEILTLHSASDIWPPFAQAVLDKWMAAKNPVTGERLRTRPHWAKEWYEFTVDGKPWVQRLKEQDYKAERQEFVDVLAEIGKEAGWTVDDLKSRFSNDLFDDLFFGPDLVRKSTIGRLMQTLSLKTAKLRGSEKSGRQTA